jgi:hypothetical protein
VAWHYIAPGKPTQNAFIESFKVADVLVDYAKERDDGSLVGSDAVEVAHSASESLKP